MPTEVASPESDSSRPTRVVGAIPARYASTRLPGKPLRVVAGRTLIEHVYRRALAAEELHQVVVLTDDDRVYDAVQAFGGEVMMTPPECASGTDRIAVAAPRWHASAVINIQGDEPLIEPTAIDRVALHLKRHPEDGMVTLAAPATLTSHEDPNVVKVVLDLSGRALYFSRSPIPFVRTDGTPPRTLHHIGIYGYQKDVLLRLASLDPTPLELCESLEQLRALEHGIEIRVLEVAQAWQGVDTIADLERVERLLEESGHAAR